MRDFDEIMNDLENLAALCRVLACSLDECESTTFCCEDFSACLHHLYQSLNQLLEEMAKLLAMVRFH